MENSDSGPKPEKAKDAKCINEQVWDGHPARPCDNPTCPMHGNLTVVYVEPLPTVRDPIPELGERWPAPGMDYYSLEEGRRRGYCK